MGDSNPRSGDWNNNTQGILVGGALGVLLVLTVILAATNHGDIAGAVVGAIAIIVIIAALKAGRHERDH